MSNQKNPKRLSNILAVLIWLVGYPILIVFTNVTTIESKTFRGTDPGPKTVFAKGDTFQILSGTSVLVRAEDQENFTIELDIGEPIIGTERPASQIDYGHDTSFIADWQPLPPEATNGEVVSDSLNLTIQAKSSNVGEEVVFKVNYDTSTQERSRYILLGLYTLSGVLILKRSS